LLLGSGHRLADRHPHQPITREASMTSTALAFDLAGLPDVWSERVLNVPAGSAATLPMVNESHRSLCRLHEVTSHNPVVSDASNNGAESGVEQFNRVTQSSRNIQDGHPSREHIKSSLKLALKEAAPQYRVPAKVIAAEVGVSDATAEAWRSGSTLPDAGNLIILARIYPEIAAAVRQLISLDSELDPGAHAIFIQLQNYVRERAGK
jgi:hypothetical protein